MLRISSSVEYAARIMTRLAAEPEGETVSAERLSASENIPRDYVDQILQRLRRAGLVQSRRGAAGGYRLALPAERISVGRVVRAVDDGVFEAVCDRYTEGDQQCSHMSGCGIRPVWQRLAVVVEDFLERVSIRELGAGESCVSDRVAALFAPTDAERSLAASGGRPAAD